MINLYKISRNLYNRSCYHACRGNTLRMKAYYYASSALLEVKTFVQSKGY